MNKEGYVSVILPTYNRRNLLPATIESVLNQTYSELELIIVDDGSDDGTLEFVSSLKDERVRYFYLEQNVGPAAARNVGIDKAQYNFIAFADSDDLWRPEKLEVQMAYMDGQTDMVYCSYAIGDEEGRRIRIPSKPCDKELLSGNIYQRLYEGNVVGTPTILIKKECLMKVGGFSSHMRSIEDWDLALRLAETAKVKYIDRILVDAHFSATGVNHQLLNRVDSEIYMMADLKKREIPNDTVLRYAIDDIQSLNSEDMARYKKEIQQKFNECVDAFKAVWHINGIKRKLELHNIILRKLCSNEKTKKFLDDRIDRRDIVAIYGLGDLGLALVEKMKDLTIDIGYIIDKNIISYKWYQIVTSAEDLGNLNISKIVVTVPEQYELIVAELDRYINCKCINIAEIMEI